MKIGMAVFSGTGNTAHVAGLLGEELQKLGVTVEICHIDSSTADFDPNCYDFVGIGHPVLGFGSPSLVLRFAEALPRGCGRMFIFKSAADNHCINNTASQKLIKIVEDKGYKVVHDFLYVMPCNWIFSYERRFNLQIIDKAKQKAVKHAQELILGTCSLMPIHRGWSFIARFIHYLEINYGRKQFAKALRVTKACSHCGHCIRNCPVRNIYKGERFIYFGENCLWCMRCVYDCPSKAIEASSMQWCIIKGGYQLRHYTEATDTNRTFITSKSSGYWKHFREYFES